MIKSSTLLIFLSALIFSSCLKDECTSYATYTKMVPVYVTEEGLRPEVKVSVPRLLQKPGKIYVYKNYLFINEIREGVHVLDNLNPEHPKPIAFIEIPGNIDIAIKDDILYADLFRDLVSIDISDIMTAHLIDRSLNVFDAYIPFDQNEGKYIVAYEPTLESVVIDCSDDQWGQHWFNRGGAIFWDNRATSFLSSNSQSGGAFLTGNFQSVGTGGSLARFTISRDHLYALDESRMNIFNIEKDIPEELNKIQLESGIETIFPSGNSLFIGANRGMLIYNITNPALPVFLSRFSHAQACDPVIVDGDIAYVTLRSGTPCANQTNQVDVLDVSNLRNPVLLKSFTMDNPHGLATVDKKLFLCEGEYGMKVFDITIPKELNKNKIAELKNHHSTDVIVLSQDVIMVIGAEGLYQYDISNIENIKLLSTVSIDSN